MRILSPCAANISMYPRKPALLKFLCRALRILVPDGGWKGQTRLIDSESLEGIIHVLYSDQLPGHLVKFSLILEAALTL